MSEKRLLSCHCSAVVIEVTFADGLENIRRCNCSLCRRKGAVMAAVPINRLKVIKGKEKLSCYQWNTKVAEHYFCSQCGIYTHHKRRSDPTQFGINIACIEGVNPYAFQDVPIGNGNLNVPLPSLSDSEGAQTKHLVSYVSHGAQEIMPYLFIQGAKNAITFYQQAFAAKEEMCLTMPDGRVAYAAIKIGNARILLADEFPEMNVHSPKSLKGSPVTVHLYVKDADSIIQKATDLGASILKPVEDQFFGDRSGSIIDPYGHVWTIATHKKDIPNEEIHHQFEQMFKGNTTS